MIVLAYALTVAALLWAVATRGRPWIGRLDEQRRQRVRLAAMVVTVLLGAAGVAVIGRQVASAGSDATVLASVIGIALVLGGATNGAGLFVWHGERALRLRLVGWVLMAAALSVPSTLTLVLPLVALLAPTLAQASAVPAQRGPAPPVAPGSASQ